MKEDLKKYLKNDECFIPLKVSQENNILLAIDRFFDEYQPERLNPEDHVGDNANMICDSLSNANR